TVSFSNIIDSPGDLAAGFTYSYDFDNNGTFVITNSTSSSVAIPAQYLKDGPGTATIHARITDRDGGFRDYTTAVSQTNVPPSIVAIPDKTVGMDSTMLINTGLVTDPGAAGTFTATVDYGEGGGEQPLTININPRSF